MEDIQAVIEQLKASTEETHPIRKKHCHLLVAQSYYYRNDFSQF